MPQVQCSVDSRAGPINYPPVYLNHTFPPLWWIIPVSMKTCHYFFHLKIKPKYFCWFYLFFNCLLLTPFAAIFLWWVFFHSSLNLSNQSFVSATHSTKTCLVKVTICQKSDGQFSVPSYLHLTVDCSNFLEILFSLGFQDTTLSWFFPTGPCAVSSPLAFNIRGLSAQYLDPFPSVYLLASLEI